MEKIVGLNTISEIKVNKEKSVPIFQLEIVNSAINVDSYMRNLKTKKFVLIFNKVAVSLVKIVILVISNRELAHFSNKGYVKKVMLVNLNIFEVIYYVYTKIKLN